MSVLMCTCETEGPDEPERNVLGRVGRCLTKDDSGPDR